ncbi:MAG: zinc-dependent peptidase [Gemmatimonadaceae bacterium]|nr:zinc-dependent peptidase [Gloeobacterales cyanobacterium ES-bin-141]
MVQAFVLSLLVIVVVWVIGAPFLTRLRRRRLRNAPCPEHWESFLTRRVHLYRRLPRALQYRLLGHVNVFLVEKQFIGCDGLEITEEIKLTIASQACLLLLGGHKECYPRVHSVLVYPGAYLVKTLKPLGEYVVREVEEVRIGESWSAGEVVLSWEDIKLDALNQEDGQNVILHEFAHQLDQEDGEADGVPILLHSADYAVWAAAMGGEYKRLRRAVTHQEKTVIDPYGATHPAEFFAVTTEAFFEQPEHLKTEHSGLYDVLKHYYQLDPATWSGQTAG